MVKQFLTYVFCIAILSGMCTTCSLNAEESTKTIKDYELQLVTYSILNTDTPISLDANGQIPAQNAPVPRTVSTPPVASPARTATTPVVTSPVTAQTTTGTSSAPAQFSLPKKKNAQNTITAPTNGNSAGMLSKPMALKNSVVSSKSATGKKQSMLYDALPDVEPPTLEDTQSSVPTQVASPSKVDNPADSLAENVSTPTEDQPDELDFSNAINSTDKFTFDPFAAQANKLKNPVLHKVEVFPMTYEGLTPGVSTLTEVVKKLGAPHNSMKQSAIQIYQYLPTETDKFDMAEVQIVFKNNVVTTILARFKAPKSIEWVEATFGIQGIKAVTVAKPDGNVLGVAYPERGVSIAYTEPKDTIMAERIILESVQFQPFTLRAEATLADDPEFAKIDLEYALKIKPQNADIHWLLGRCLMNLGDSKTAITEIEKAIALDANQPRYMLSLAQAQAAQGLIEQAEKTVNQAIELTDNKENPRPQLTASAWQLKGDLVASKSVPDYKKALEYHSKSIVIAQRVLESKETIPMARQEAYQALVSAHLGAAHDIAWGTWNQKASAVNRWLIQANKYNEKLIKVASYSEKQANGARLNVAKRALSACAGVGKDINPAQWVEMLIVNGDKQLSLIKSPEQKEKLMWDMGMAIYDAVQIFQARGENDLAMKYGLKAVECLETVNHGSVQIEKFTADDLYVQGRLYFRLGAISAIGGENHQAAVEWYQKALPIFEVVVDGIPRAELGRLGETLVSMGVSYWEVGKQNQAVNLTENGIYCLEQAAEDGLSSASSLEIPYRNLSLMLKNIGKKSLSEKYLQKANAAKTVTR